MDNEPNKYNEYMKAYYHKNKERLTQKVMCETCNFEVSKRTMVRHKLSNRHIRNFKANHIETEQ